MKANAPVGRGRTGALSNRWRHCPLGRGTGPTAMAEGGTHWCRSKSVRASSGAAKRYQIRCGDLWGKSEPNPSEGSQIRRALAVYLQPPWPVARADPGGRHLGGETEELIRKIGIQQTKIRKRGIDPSLWRIKSRNPPTRGLFIQFVSIYFAERAVRKETIWVFFVVENIGLVPCRVSQTIRLE